MLIVKSPCVILHCRLLCSKSTRFFRRWAIARCGRLVRLECGLLVFYLVKFLRKKKEKKKCIFRTVIANSYIRTNFHERENRFHHECLGSHMWLKLKMAAEKWSIHHFSRANVVSGYFSLLTQLFPGSHPSRWRSSQLSELVRANFVYMHEN